MPRIYDWIDDAFASGELTFESRTPVYVEVFYSLSKDNIDLWKNHVSGQN